MRKLWVAGLSASLACGVDVQCPAGMPLVDDSCVRADAGQDSITTVLADGGSSDATGQGDPRAERDSGIDGGVDASVSSPRDGSAPANRADPKDAAQPTPDAAAHPPPPTVAPEGASCTPTEERCDSVDNDCDGTVDEGVTDACGGCQGPPTNAICKITEKNRCKPGHYVCDSGVIACEALPAFGLSASGEVCGNKLDDNCDGTVDEGCACLRCPADETYKWYPEGFSRIEINCQLGSARQCP